MQSSTKKITLGIPNGSLQEYTLRIFKEAGFDVGLSMEEYILKIDDPEIECFLLSPQEIPKYVEREKLDAGITSEDSVYESKAKVIKVVELEYGKQKLGRLKQCLIVPENSKIKSVKDLEGKTVSTEFVNVVKDYLRKNGVKARVEFSHGSTGTKPPKFADAIVDLVETEDSLRANNLKIIDTISESPVALVAGKNVWQDKRKKRGIKDLALLLQGAIKGEEFVNLMFYVLGEKLNRILKFLPKLKSPTIKKLAGENWYNVTIGCEAKGVRELIPKLKKMGCQGIVEYPAVKLVP